MYNRQVYRRQNIFSYLFTVHQYRLLATVSSVGTEVALPSVEPTFLDLMTVLMHTSDEFYSEVSSW